MLRELASGDVTEAFQWDPRVLDASAQDATWSPDGRSLLVTPGAEWGMGVGEGDCVELDDGLCVYPPDNRYADPVLLNTETMETFDLPATFGGLGMPNGDALFPYLLDFPYSIEMSGAEEVSLPLFDHTGKQRGAIPHEVIPGQQGAQPGKEKDDALGSISADGHTLVAMKNDSRHGANDGKLFVIDVEDPRVVDELQLKDDRTDFDSPEFHGWAHDDEIVMSAFDSVEEGRCTTYAIDVDTGQKTALLKAVLPDYGLVINDVAYALL